MQKAVFFDIDGTLTGAAQAADINFMWADIWRTRYSPGIHEAKNVNKEVIEFLEGIKI